MSKTPPTTLPIIIGRISLLHLFEYEKRTENEESWVLPIALTDLHLSLDITLINAKFPIIHCAVIIC